MLDPYQQYNVPVAPVDSQFSIPMPAAQIQNFPDNQHLGDVISQYVSNQQNQQPNLAQQILANRFQPDLTDASRSVFESNQRGQYVAPEQVMAQRYEAELSPYTSMLKNQMSAGTQYMNMSGGGTGVLINRLMQANPGMSFPEALYAVQGGGMRQGLQMGPNGNVTALPGVASAMGQVKYGENLGGTTGTKQAELGYAGPIAQATTTAQESTKQQYAAPIAQATEMGKNAAENMQQGLATNDIVGLYGKLQKDAATAPSGLIESAAARAANAANIPTQGSIAQATFDADLNNLYLATIRSLKGTGRVMEQELNKIAESAPKSTDSMEVKMAKAQAHMEYYQQRMRSLGYNPNIGTSSNIPSMDASQLSISFQEGQTASNPQTGQKIIFKNGQWSPM